MPYFPPLRWKVTVSSPAGNRKASLAMPAIRGALRVRVIDVAELLEQLGAFGHWQVENDAERDHRALFHVWHFVANDHCDLFAVRQREIDYVAVAHREPLARRKRAALAR